MTSDEVMWAANHDITARLNTRGAVNVARRLLDGLHLDQVVASELGRHRLREAWPWLELCVRGNLVEVTPRAGPRSYQLLLSSEAWFPPPGETCPIEKVWRVAHLRIILEDRPAAGVNPLVRCVERFRRPSARIGRLREVASRARGDDERPYPPFGGSG